MQFQLAGATIPSKEYSAPLHRLAAKAQIKVLEDELAETLSKGNCLTLCILGIHLCFCYHLQLFFKIIFFHIFLINTFKVLNGLGSEHFSPDLGSTHSSYTTVAI